MGQGKQRFCVVGPDLNEGAGNLTNRWAWTQQRTPRRRRVRWLGLTSTSQAAAIDRFGAPSHRVPAGRIYGAGQRTNDPRTGPAGAGTTRRATGSEGRRVKGRCCAFRFVQGAVGRWGPLHCEMRRRQWQQPRHCAVTCADAESLSVRGRPTGREQF